MVTLEEMVEVAGWSTDDAQAALQAKLPAGWRLSYEHEEGEWVVQLIDDQGVVAFESVYPEPRLVLLNAYGFLHRRAAGPVHPMWAGGGRADRRGPRAPGELGLPGFAPTPDPDDLDPAAVDLVYTRRP